MGIWLGRGGAGSPSEASADASGRRRAQPSLDGLLGITS